MISVETTCAHLWHSCADQQPNVVRFVKRVPLCDVQWHVKDEAEWMENDAAARWLQKNENRALRK